MNKFKYLYSDKLFNINHLHLIAFPEKKEKLIAETSYKFKPEINQISKDKYFQAY